MGSFRGNCEIVEEPSTVRQPQSFRRGREQKPPTLKKVLNKSLEDDIDKLFAAINLRTSKSLDLSDSGRNPSKKPMRGTGSHSPGIGFSEPVSLKQALRGLCISQAAETAAMKRSSMPSGSPRISEAGKITNNLYRSVVVEGGESGQYREESTSFSSRKVSPYLEQLVVKSAPQSVLSSPRFGVKPGIRKVECSEKSDHSVTRPKETVVQGESPTVSAKKLPHQLPEPKMKSPNQSAHNSPRFIVTPVIKDVISTPVSEVDFESLGTLHSQEKTCTKVASLSHHLAGDVAPKPIKELSESDKVQSGLIEKSASSAKVTDKPRRKSRLQTISSSSAAKSSKEARPARNTNRKFKPVIKNKNLIIRKPKKVLAATAEISNNSYEVNSALDQSPGHLICQRCQCSLREEGTEAGKFPAESTWSELAAGNRNCGVKKEEDAVPNGSVNNGPPVIKTEMTPRSRDKGDFSQSSKSSICDFSSSTTSLSEESNVSGSMSGNKPHMSKDSKWEAIDRVKKLHGFLGLSHFNLLKKLGSGDIGTVYLAELIGTGGLFAIKVMDNEFLARRKKMPRAQTEREILRMLDHPFLPTLYAQFTSDNLSCLVMEFCPGGDLHVLRQKQPGRYFPEQAARFYVAEVLLALEYLHMLGIVYRDLKPENIMVREDGHIMLTDFDLSLRCSVNPMLVKSSSLVLEPPRISGPCAGSKCIDPFCAAPSCKMSCFSPRLLPATARARKLKAEAAAQARLLPQLVAEPTEARSNSFVGTHEYLAPEIIKGEGHGSAVDWWTFGVLLYELLYGRTPFRGSGNEETLTNVVLQNLKFPDSPMVSFQARDLIRGLLVKEPENRLGTETGAAEIKRHPFFDGLNWALIRCAIPPQVPEFCDAGFSRAGSGEKGQHVLEYNASGEHLEFELF